MTGAEVTRGEFDMLRDQVNLNAGRLDAIDRNGTRGVGIVQQQLMDLKGDVTELRMRMEKHEGEHVQVERDRRNGRRWLVGIGVVLFAAVESPLFYVIIHLH